MKSGISCKNTKVYVSEWWWVIKLCLCHWCQRCTAHLSLTILGSCQLWHFHIPHPRMLHTNQSLCIEYEKAFGILRQTRNCNVVIDFCIFSGSAQKILWSGARLLPTAGHPAWWYVLHLLDLSCCFIEGLAAKPSWPVSQLHRPLSSIKCCNAHHIQLCGAIVYSQQHFGVFSKKVFSSSKLSLARQAAFSILQDSALSVNLGFKSF